MDNPVKEIEHVIRSITEPYEASIIAANVDKYFTEDAYILHPFLKSNRTSHGRDDLKGIYKMLRVFVVNNKIKFHAVMFSPDGLHGTIELSEYAEPRLSLLKSLTIDVRFITRIDLRQESDGKYRIYRQQDNFPTDLQDSGFMTLPGLKLMSEVIKYSIGIGASMMGNFLLPRGIFGP